MPFLHWAIQGAPGHHNTCKHSFDSVEVSGKFYRIETSDATRVGRNHKKRNLVLIGGGV